MCNDWAEELREAFKIFLDASEDQDEDDRQEITAQMLQAGNNTIDSGRSISQSLSLALSPYLCQRCCAMQSFDHAL
eukprot:COSAG05_NODE_4669_length_1416_cov_18.246014_3_plen_76_part_00